MNPSLSYLYHKIVAVEPRAQLLDERAWRLKVEWVSVASADTQARSGFLYFVEMGVRVKRPAATDAEYGCVLHQSMQGLCAGVPRIVVPDEADLQKIFDLVVDEIDRLRSWESGVRDLIAEGASLQSLIDAAFSLVPRPMYFADPCWRMIAHVDAGMEEMSSGWRHELLHGCLPLELTEKLNSTGEYRMVTAATRAQYVETKAFNLCYVSKTLRRKGRFLGYYFIIDTWNDLGLCEIELAEHFGNLVAAAFDAQGSGMLGGVRYHENLVTALLADKSCNRNELENLLAATAGWPMEGDFRIAVTRLEDHEARNPMTRMQIESQLGSKQDSYTAASEELSFVLLRAADERSGGAEGHLSHCARTLRRQIIMSPRFMDFASAPLYCRQLAQGIRRVDVLAAYESTALVSYDRLFRYFLASGCEADVGASYEIELLAKHDKVHGTDYVHTLYAYLRNERNAVATAADLHLHRNSLRNRIEKIAGLIDCDLSDSDLRLRLYIGLVVLLRGGR